MSPIEQLGPVTLCHGNSLDVLQWWQEETFDSIITDPPYALSFMGKDWDAMHPDKQIWQECWRVLKPGGYLLSFGGTRTWHRLCCDIEDSGFEIRDSIAWLYGSGFPKSLDVSKAIDARELVGKSNSKGLKAANRQRPDGGENPYAARRGASGSDMMRRSSIENGFKTEASEPYTGSERLTAPATDAAKQWQGWGTALKPAFEPIIVARKPFGGTVAANVLAHGTGALNIDACRIATDEVITNHSRGAESAVSKGIYGDSCGQDTHQTTGQSLGRWPSNVVLDGDMADELDRQSGTLTSGKVAKGGFTGPFKANVYGKFDRNEIREETVYGDSGGASRFFPTFRYQAKAPARERPKVDGISHPTVKPLELMRWLVKLVTPVDGWVLDPFAGSGTTAQAAMLEGMRCCLIERYTPYLPLIKARLADAV